MAHPKGVIVLGLKPLVSQCSLCLRVIEVPFSGSFFICIFAASIIFWGKI